jgi:hypothetical protein
MRAQWIWVAGLAGLGAGCGGGHALFNVDVYSFIPPARDTIPYAMPPSSSGPISSVPQKVSLPGAGKSLALSVALQGTANLVNATGSGTIALQVYLAADSLGTYAPSAGVFTPPPSGNVSPATTTPVSFAAPDLGATLDSLFTKSALWVRLAATVSNTSLVVMQGNMVLTSLHVQVVLQPKLF